MSYFTSEQRRNIDRLKQAISRKRDELKHLPSKLKGRSPKDIARIGRYVQADIAYLLHYLTQWEAEPAAPVCTYASRSVVGNRIIPASSPSVGKPSRSR